ncbi:5-amino-6-(D-ribitylamino)uracil--L-tyrosine 4-hydroxyphenyl transferase CofH [Methanobrevibacter boviskoreani]|uniref:5-amino-6-(D-ribitylamino)uracil--L-tyrosine 4-hydroxyphenyl transferase CofH n=1 Tax=Methanobrevibacter boviskoreani TaxID=1348249 RepID=UPI0023A7EE84|nr:5-amino-6-(D-ribitylamino)uracil--L-tyrosine 4-hydroxyphenyl transferase CofH [Methanobrevibacter boviskoreani]MCI6775630.1 5-amino-6-(D-ribitylamino)uracil--L-tyrosine 4-hydroxyphenyl transferase CofH [Methanobrevibacter boviskoreani]MDY5614310.1 5-amino-6-(D-ribitylamino)uracil--L-tyrosine 4-hydroxyphenyl transferase CofH [Methanobrevibacter boviskoreani]
MISAYEVSNETKKILDNALDEAISVEDANYLMNLKGSDVFALLETADYLRKEIVGDNVSFINNCNINFTNICKIRCGFCAFGKDKDDPDAYIQNDEEILSKAQNAVENGAREFTLMGGVLEEADIDYYEHLLKLLKDHFPDVMIHGFSPTMIFDACKKSEMSLEEGVKILKKAGLDSLPGTAAEILTDRSRSIICPKKVSTQEWVDVVTTVHKAGIPGSATMMYGHVETVAERVETMKILRDVQEETHGFTEFIPMTFMPNYSPIFLNGQKNLGATGIEDLKLYATGRLMFRDLIPNIQVSWVKMGYRFAQISLLAGANDLGGTLGGDELSEASGAPDGVDASIKDLIKLVNELGRIPIERNTKYTEFFPIAGK